MGRVEGMLRCDGAQEKACAAARGLIQTGLFDVSSGLENVEKDLGSCPEQIVDARKGSGVTIASGVCAPRLAKPGAVLVAVKNAARRYAMAFGHSWGCKPKPAKFLNHLDFNGLGYRLMSARSATRSIGGRSPRNRYRPSKWTCCQATGDTVRRVPSALWSPAARYRSSRAESRIVVSGALRPLRGAWPSGWVFVGLDPGHQVVRGSRS